ncbi:DUF2993 domain-containing protein [Agromyces sp. NPDC127015]|uniref:LmeA family phospholipid-binding protein n=1 Tax=Agromyces sp. NPDC127015 TaxID=3347108 RepID=UPI00364F097E
MSDEQPTIPLDVEDPEPAPRKRLGRGAKIGIVVAAVVVGLVAIAVVADVIARGVAEQRVAEEIRANLPDQVDGDVDVTIGGFSVIAQYLSGSMDEVALSAPDLEVDGAPIDAQVTLQQVPVDLASPVGHLTATVSTDEASLNRLIDVPGATGTVTLGDGTVGYEGSVEVLGAPISYQVTAAPTAAGDRILLEPVGVEVGAGGASFDVSGLIQRLIGDDPVPVCVAEHLPEGIEVTGVAVAPGAVRVDLAGDDVELDGDALGRTGHCD